MLRPHARVLGPFVAFLAVVSCGGEPPRVVTKPPPPVVKVTRPPPVRARWAFSRPERGILAKLDLGADGVLYVGQNGRRQITKGAEPPADAPTLALDDLAGVLRDDKGQFAFVADDGDVYPAPTALGEFAAERPGPLADAKPGTKLLALSTGHAAILAVTPDGRLVRSADFGASWKPVDYAGASKPYGRPASVALDSKGNGLLLHFPQRLFVTHDDGATWAPLASPGIGAKRVTKDGADGLFLLGFGQQRARFDGKALAVTKDAPKPILELSRKALASFPDDADVRSVLSGDHVVELALRGDDDKKSLEVTSTKLGDRAAAGVKIPELEGGDTLSDLLAGYGSDIVYVRPNTDQDATAPTSTLFRSADSGVTWKKEASLEGASPASSGLAIAVGPKGWTYVGPLCPPRDESDGYRGGDDDEEESEPSQSDEGCARRQIRPAGAAAFEEMVFVEEFSPDQFAFDEAHDRVYATGVHDGRKYLYESPLSLNKFTRTKLLDLGGGTNTSMTVDAKGTVRVFEREGWGLSGHWTLHRRGADGKEQPKVYLALPAGTLSFAGSRGLLFGGHTKGWETADGGETWMRVASNGFVEGLTCTDAGCLNAGAARVGWDIPVVDGGEKVLATAEPDKTKPPTPAPASDTPAAPPPTQLTCKPGPATRVASYPGSELIDGRWPDARWASVKRGEDGKMSILVGSRTQMRELPLLPGLPKAPATPVKPAPGAKPVPGAKPAPPPPEVRSGERVLDDGVIAARYTFAPKTTDALNPVDVDLAWWSVATGKTTRHLLPAVKPFRVSRYGFSGSATIVDGGLLFQSEDREPVYFVHDDGKVEMLPIPADATLRNVERVGKRWILADADGGNVQLSFSDDNGKTWGRKSWGLDASAWPSLRIVGDKAMLGVSRGGLPAMLFALDATIPDDPPAPILIDASSPAATCDAQAGRLRVYSPLSYERRTVHANVDTVQGATKAVVTFTATSRLLHDTATGKMCTSAYTANGSSPGSSDQSVFLFPEAKGWSGWRFHRTTDPKDHKTFAEAEPLTCTVAKTP